VQLQGQMVHGRPIKCSWGKDRADGGTTQPGAPLSPAPAATPYGNLPMYGMPQPNTYGQYGFAGYPAGTPGAGSPGMPQAAPGGGLGLTGTGQQGGADPNAAQAGQQQWPAGTDPSAYYSNYWGGYYGQAAGQGVDGQAPA